MSKRFQGPLRVSERNPRYFMDDTGRPIYLTGSHTWANLVEIRVDGTPDFPYDEWLDFMTAHEHNFMRMWTWQHPEMAPWTLKARMLASDPWPSHPYNVANNVNDVDGNPDHEAVTDFFSLKVPEVVAHQEA